MGRNTFGWSYPAGAEHDPNAPWNQPDLPEECPTCRKSSTDEDGDALHDGVFCSLDCESRWEEP